MLFAGVSVAILSAVLRHGWHSDQDAHIEYQKWISQVPLRQITLQIKVLTNNLG